MFLLPCVEKSLNFLPRIEKILNRRRSGSYYHPIVRMSDLVDELYQEELIDLRVESRGSVQEDVEFNNQIVNLSNEKLTRSGKKKTIKIKIKISEIKNEDNETENATGAVETNGKNSTESDNQNEFQQKILKTKMSGTTYLIELRKPAPVTTCRKLEFENSFTGVKEENDTNDLNKLNSENISNENNYNDHDDISELIDETSANDVKGYEDITLHKEQNDEIIKENPISNQEKNYITVAVEKSNVNVHKKEIENNSMENVDTSGIKIRNMENSVLQNNDSDYFKSIICTEGDSSKEVTEDGLIEEIEESIRVPEMPEEDENNEKYIDEKKDQSIYSENFYIINTDVDKINKNICPPGENEFDDNSITEYQIPSYCEDQTENIDNSCTLQNNENGYSTNMISTEDDTPKEVTEGDLVEESAEGNEVVAMSEDEKNIDEKEDPSMCSENLYGINTVSVKNRQNICPGEKEFDDNSITKNQIPTYCEDQPKNIDNSCTKVRNIEISILQNDENGSSTNMISTEDDTSKEVTEGDLVEEFAEDNEVVAVPEEDEKNTDEKEDPSMCSENLYRLNTVSQNICPGESKFDNSILESPIPSNCEDHTKNIDNSYTGTIENSISQNNENDNFTSIICIEGDTSEEITDDLKEEIAENNEVVERPKSDEKNEKYTAENKDKSMYSKNLNTTYTTHNKPEIDNVHVNPYVVDDDSKNISENILLNEDKIRDYQIIRDIIWKKFGTVVERFKQRSLRRKQKRARPAIYQNKETDVNDNVFCKMYISPQSAETLDSGFDATQEFYSDNSKSTESIKNSNHTFESRQEYDSTQFLKEALGEEYMNMTGDSQEENSTDNYLTPKQVSTPVPTSHKRTTDRSIGSSEISTLVSRIDGALYRTLSSLYSTVDKSKKTRPTVLKKATVSSRSTSTDNYIYESIEKFKVNPKSEELSNAISVQCAIIAQSIKAVSFCRQSAVFFGAVPHLEAEKCLLFSTLRKQILEKQLYAEYNEIAGEQCFANVNMKNLSFSIVDNNSEKPSNITEYYVCLVYSGVTLYASDILSPDENGLVVFKKSFHFAKLLSDFEIRIEVYSTTLESNFYRKKLYISPQKKCPTSKNGKVHNKHISKSSETSSFQLLGTCKLGVLDIFHSNTFVLQKLKPNGRLSHFFTADIQSSVNINNNICGFLTIGTTNILWNRRWCVLQGSFLKYWNYPSDETVKEPIGVFNLTDCATHQVTNVDKKLCSRPRTISLKIKSEEVVREYFLQADNLLEFEEWKRQLNSVLISLKNWNYLQC